MNGWFFKETTLPVQSSWRSLPRFDVPRVFQRRASLAAHNLGPYHAQSAEFGGNGRVLDRFFNSGNQRLCHLGRHSRRREEGQPDAKEVLAVAELRQRGDLGELRNLIRGEYSLHRSALQVAE